VGAVYADRPHLLYSLSKSFTSMAVGLAIEEGLLSVNDSLRSGRQRHRARRITAGALLAADDELANRLAGLALPVPSTDTRGRPGLFTPGDSLAVAMVTAVLLRQIGQDYALEISLDGAVHTMPVGDGRWLAGQWPTEPPIPFVSAGGWHGGRFVAELRMIQTPHLLRIVLDPATGTFDSH
jgi:Beta-lactamase